MSYVYIQSKNLYTVGFYDPNGRWHSDSDHDSKQEAAERASHLNGSNSAALVACAMLNRAMNQVSNVDEELWYQLPDMFKQAWDHARTALKASGSA